ncbi:putative transposase for the insertion element IS2606 [Mycobacterium ulcerans str. Harvey]|uniref:Transposase for the insertion element IS2606 n=1 Tax=Mycobacterium ulcerans str. Harvey TaxID=1299332 RepID=A0ABN0R9J2_MYCUL|nr:putative transposase for the insertion element IS2606 [Mycobacterium ulcerans str. Harvey]
MDEELSEHLGYDRHDRAGYGRATRATEPARKRCSLMRAVPLRSMSHGIGQAHSSEDRRKRQRRLTDVDEVVLSLYAAVDHRGDQRPFRPHLRRGGVQGHR